MQRLVGFDASSLSQKHFDKRSGQNKLKLTVQYAPDKWLCVIIDGHLVGLRLIHTVHLERLALAMPAETCDAVDVKRCMLATWQLLHGISRTA